MVAEDYMQLCKRLLSSGVEESYYYELFKTGVILSLEQSRLLKIDPSLTTVGKFVEEMNDKIVINSGNFYFKKT
jgi:hypothetical protein